MQWAGQRYINQYSILLNCKVLALYSEHQTLIRGKYQVDVRSTGYTA